MAQQIQLPIVANATLLQQSIQQSLNAASKNAKLNLGGASKQISALHQPLGRITGQADEFTKSMSAANARVFAFGASVGVISAVSKAFSVLVSSTISVEKSLASININLNQSGADLDKFGDKLFSLAKNTGQTFETVAEGALELSRQGKGATQIIKDLNDVLILSRLSGLSAQQSVEGLTAALNSFKEAGLSSEQIVNKLVVVAQKYAVSEKDLIEGIKRSASVADQAGVSFDNLVGIITAVQERTARGGAVIGNSLKTIFSRLQDTSSLQDLRDLGVEVTNLSTGAILPATKIMENLAKQFDSFSQTKQTDIAKKLGGVYQLSNFLAAIKDLSSAQSVYAGASAASSKASSEAYQKNAALNETLFAIINKVTLSAEQLGATLGKLGFTDNFKSILAVFGGILDYIQQILSEESGMGTFFKGLAKGIGAVISGPGLALFGAIILKLTKDLVSFGIGSLKTFFNFGKAAREVADIEGSLVSILSRNVNLQQQLLALGNDRVAQAKLLNSLISQQEASIRAMAAITGPLAPMIHNSGGRVRDGVLRAPNAASGYMPAVAAENAAIKSGVGGASSSDKAVVIPNFAFGGGKTGPMVVNTSEYIVPNFANGGSAVFNRDMVRSMGLPNNAQKINAADGFVPNFVQSIGGFDIFDYGKTPDRNALKELGINMADIVRSVSSQQILASDKDSLGMGKFKDGASVLYTVGNNKIKVPLSQLNILKNSDNTRSEIKSQSAINKGLVAAGIASEKTPKAPRLADITLDANSFGGVGLLALQGLNKSGGVSVPSEEVWSPLFAKVGKKSVFDNLTKKTYRKSDGGLPPVFERAGISAKDLPPGQKGDGGTYVFDRSRVGVGGDENKKDSGPSVRLTNVKTFNPSAIKSTEEFSKTVNQYLAGPLAGLAGKMYGQFGFGASSEIEQSLKAVAGSRQGGLLSSAAEGSIFEAVAKVAFGSFKEYGSAFKEDPNRPFDFKGASLEAVKKSIGAGAPNVAFVDAKRTGDDSALRSLFKKLINDPDTAPMAVSQLTKGYADFYKNSKSSTPSFLPNFADPLKAAIGREINAGVPASRIYVDQHTSLKSSSNPMGLMVANTRDEPQGGFQGINRARKEGSNPSTYGAASGFVPNFAAPIPSISGDVQRAVGATSFSPEVIKAVDAFGKKAIAAGGNMDKLSVKLEQALIGLGNSADAAKLVANESKSQAMAIKASREANTANIAAKKLNTASSLLQDPQNRALTKTIVKAIDAYNRSAKTSIDLANLQTKIRVSAQGAGLKPSQVGALSSSAAAFASQRNGAQEAKAPRDMLGIIFAAQAVFSLLNGSVGDATDGIGELTKRVSSALSVGTTVGFAGTALKGLAKEGSVASSVLGNVGIYGALAAAAFEGFRQWAAYMDDNNVSLQNASKSLEAVSAAAAKAAVNLSSYTPSEKKELTKKRGDLISGATRFTSDSYSYRATMPSMGGYGTQGAASTKQSTTTIAKFEGLSDELETTLNDSIDQALAVGVSYQRLWKLVNEAAKSDMEITGAEVSAIDGEIKKIIDGISSSDSVAKHFKLNAKSGMVKILAKASEEDVQNSLDRNPQKVLRRTAVNQTALYNLSKQPMSKDNATLLQKWEASPAMNMKPLSPLDQKIDQITDYLISTGQGKGEALNKNIKNAVSSAKDISKQSIEDEEKARELQNTNLIKDQLKGEVELAAARGRGLDDLDRAKIASEVLGNLSEKEVRSLENQASLKSILGASAEKARGVLSEQISSMEGIMGDGVIFKGVLSEIGQLNDESLTDNKVLMSLFERINTIAETGVGLSESKKKALNLELDKIKELTGIDKERLKSAYEYQEAKRNELSIINSIAQKLNLEARAKNFSTSLQADKTISSNDLKISNLEQSKIGRSDVDIRAIEKEKSSIELQNVIIDNGKKVAEALQKAKEDFGKALPARLGADEIERLSNSKNSPSELSSLLEDIIKDPKYSIDGKTNKGDESNPIVKAAQELKELQETTNQLSESTLAAANNTNKLAGALPRVLDALGQMSNYLGGIPQKMQDLEFEKMTTTSGKRLAEIEYEKKTNQMLLDDPSNASRIIKDRSVKSPYQSIKESFSQTEYEKMASISTMLADGSVQFRDNLIEGISTVIEKGGTLGDILRSAAMDFARQMTKTGMTNLSNSLFSAVGTSISGYASGGPIMGGSGNKDDIPAMLMGGEYVINKRAAKQLGPQFLDALNSGKVNGYSKGGEVQSGGRGTYQIPGTYGSGAILGSKNLFDFATQSYTNGARDKIVSNADYGSVSLETESSNLTNFGRRNGPAAEALRSAKEDALGLYFEDYNKKRELAKQQKAQEKAFRTQLIVAAVSMAAGAAASSAAKGYGNAYSTSANTGSARYMDALKGAWSGADIGKGYNSGGLANMFNGHGNESISKASLMSNDTGPALSNTSQASANQAGTVQAAGIGPFDANGNYREEWADDPSKWTNQGASNGAAMSGPDGKYYGSNAFPIPAGASSSSSNNSYNLDVDDPAKNPALWNSTSGYNKRATGGSIRSTSGVDTIPTMLSGGEFIMNKSAARNIGAGNLEAMNAGAKSIVTEEKSEELNDKLIAKIDELIGASSEGGGSITINIESNGKSDQTNEGQATEAKQQLARQVKDAVLKVIQDEKRLGGQLRR